MIDGLPDTAAALPALLTPGRGASRTEGPLCCRSTALTPHLQMAVSLAPTAPVLVTPSGIVL